MRPAQGGMQINWPKPGRAILAIIGLNIVAYVLELVLLRANVTFVADLFLTPSDVLERGRVWQIFSYMWLHDPKSVMHLVFNMLWVFWLGSQLEKWWGTKRFVLGYLIFGLGGAAFTLLVALASRTELVGPLLGGFWSTPHMGASGAVMGITVGWCLAMSNQTVNFLFLPPMKGRTFLWLMIAFQLLVALSFDPTSSTSHFGGMIAAFILCLGLWKPSRWKDMFRRYELERRRKQIESELKVLDGGASSPTKLPPKKPTEWN